MEFERVWTAANWERLLVGDLVNQGVLGGLLLMRRVRQVPSQTPTRLSIATPGQVTAQLSVAVSPDGRRLAYV